MDPPDNNLLELNQLDLVSMLNPHQISSSKKPSIISQILSPDDISPPIVQDEHPGAKNSFDTWTARFYCISLKNSDRRERIKRRFAYHGLLPWLTFVDAIPIDSPLIERYTEGTIPDTDKFEYLATASCFASHLKAIRTYLEDPDSNYSKGAIICEDDVLLRNNWRELYQSVMDNMPEDAKIVQFSYMLDTWGNTQWVGKEPGKENIFKLKISADQKELPAIHSTAAWGTQMYWISQSQAKNSLNQFDRPFIHLQDFSLVTSELITILPRGYLVYPIMVIEDCIGSLIRNQSKQDYHLKIFSPWGYSNFNGGDDDGKSDPASPLFQIEKASTGRRPPPPPTSKFN